MKRLTFTIAAAFAAWCGAASSRAASLDVSVSFYGSLAPYGEWIEHSRFGTVWAPRHVDATWRPYTRGRWLYSDYGWTWASDEDWGWATDHYGRWYLDRAEGWIWVPGDEWAPAWVGWRSGEGYVGWAPLPPEIDAFGAVDYDVDPFTFCFVEERHFLSPGVYHHFVPIARNVTYLRFTRNVTRYARMNDRIINHGLDVRRFERLSGHPVPHAQIREVWSAVDARRVRGRHGEVAFFHPAVVNSRPVDASFSPEPWRSDADRPDRVLRRQEQERRQVESGLAHERHELEKRQQHEIKHAPQVFAEKEREHDQLRPIVIQPLHPLNREKLRERHQAERNAQAELERRQLEILQQRHEREQRAVQSRKDLGRPDDSHHKRDHH